MTTISHEPARAVEPEQSWSLQLLVPEMWAFLAIMVMWLAVLFDAIWGPSLQTFTVAGDHTTIPSAIFVALFAFLGTWVVARYGFRRDRKD